MWGLGKGKVERRGVGLVQLSRQDTMARWLHTCSGAGEQSYPRSVWKIEQQGFLKDWLWFMGERRKGRHKGIWPKQPE